VLRTVYDSVIRGRKKIKKEIKQCRPFLSPAIIATVILLGTSVFAHNTKQNNRFAFDHHGSTTNQNLLLSSTIAGAKPLDFWLFSNVNGGQEKTQYPKPDFSIMAEWYEVTKVEYHIFDRVLNYVIILKVESRPWVFELRFVDEDGVIILETSACSSNLWEAPIDVPIKCGSLTPTETQMEKVKKGLCNQEENVSFAGSHELELVRA
jgi:hypothetical protein